MAAATYTDATTVFDYMNTPAEDRAAAASIAILTADTVTASRTWERLTGLTYGVETGTAVVMRGSKVVWAADGRLLVRLPVANPLTVTAADVRWAGPRQGWVTLDPTLAEWDTADPRGADRITLWPDPAFVPVSAPPLAVRLSYTAGYAPNAYPPEIVDWVTRCAAWLYRHRNAPYTKTANIQTGIVSVPTNLPGDLKLIVSQWQRW